MKKQTQEYHRKELHGGTFIKSRMFIINEAELQALKFIKVLVHYLFHQAGLYSLCS